MGRSRQVRGMRQLRSILPVRSHRNPRARWEESCEGQRDPMQRLRHVCGRLPQRCHATERVHDAPVERDDRLPRQTRSGGVAVTEFKPTILAFCCNWCSYAGADLAGVSRLQMPPNVHVIRVMCSASVKPEYVMKAISQGIDGVLILGCHIGDCHYMTGNHRTAKRMPVVQKILKDVGIDEKRVRVDWVSAGEGEEFQKVITEFVDEVAKLGPNPLRE